jgi:hypothetical protein
MARPLTLDELERSHNGPIPVRAIRSAMRQEDVPTTAECREKAQAHRNTAAEFILLIQHFRQHPEVTVASWGRLGGDWTLDNALMALRQQRSLHSLACRRMGRALINERRHMLAAAE